jgi:hypothetical protein
MVRDSMTTKQLLRHCRKSGLDNASKAKIKQEVRAFASDVDGTLLTSVQTMYLRTNQAIERRIHIRTHYSTFSRQLENHEKES